MKLAELALGETCLHSSQIYGFRTGKLKEPGPKVLMVVGYLSLAIAAGNGDEEAESHLPLCPPHERSTPVFRQELDADA